MITIAADMKFSLSCLTPRACPEHDRGVLPPYIGGADVSL
jgi:hypothetical protein